MSGNAALAVAGSVEDSDLVAAVRQGDDRAFEQLYARYHARVAAYVRGMVKDHARAEDVTQEVFFSALRRMRQTDRPIAFKPWVYEIARNACIDAYRRTSRAEELSYDAEGGLPAADSMRLVSANPGPDDAIESKQRLDDLCGAFGGLSETHHQILVLRELEGLSYREIGERLGMSRAAVESTLFRARRRLTEEYDELVTGRRCQRVQAIMAAAAEGMLGARDRRKLARHLTSCQACRRHAAHLGVDVGERPSVAARIAGLLPFPVLFARGRGGGAGGAAAAPSGSGFLAQASASLGMAAEPMAAAWGKAVAAVAMLAVAGAGAGAVANHGLPIPGLKGLPVVGALSSEGRDGRGADVALPGHPAWTLPGAGSASGGALDSGFSSSGQARHTAEESHGDGASGAAQRSTAGGGAVRSAGTSESGPGLPSPSAGAPSVALPDVGAGSGGTPESSPDGTGGTSGSAPAAPDSPDVDVPRISPPATTTEPTPAPDEPEAPSPETPSAPSAPVDADASSVRATAAAVNA